MPGIRMWNRPLQAGVVLGVMAALPSGGLAQASRPMTPEDVVAARLVSDPRISPDGSRVLFVVREADLEANDVRSSIWVHEVETGDSLRLTHVEARHGSPRWSPSGDGFVFLSDRSGSMQLWWMPAAGGEPRQLGESATPVGALAWAPGGERIAYTAAEALPEDAAERREAGDDARIFGELEDLPKLWLLDVATEEARQLTREALGIQGMAWAPDGSALVVAARPSTILDAIGETELYQVDAVSGAMRRLTDNDAVESAPIVTAGGDAVFYTAPDAERFVNRESNLFRLDLATGAVTELAADYRYGLDAPALGAGGGTVVLQSGVRAAERLVELDVASGDIRDLTPASGSVRGFDVASDGRIAYVFTDAGRLPDLWLRDSGGSPRGPVTDLNPGQREWQLGETRVETWRSRDGAEVEGLLTLPAGHAAGAPAPLMVVIHGGPEAAMTLGHVPSYMDYHQVLAGAGWAVLRPNYRGGTNYGDAWVQGMNGDTGGGDYEDIMSGVDHLIAAGIADPDRLAVMGWSWGGISTGWIVTHTDRFRAASAGAMVSDHFSVFGQADLTFDVEHFYVGGSPWADPARYLSMSPIGHVTSARTPTLLLHGEADERCPLPQSVEFYKGLRSVGVDAELVVYPREPHVFREPRHQLDKMQRELAWFGRWVTGAPAPTPSSGRR
jgi:dipeptidyl aminopeptidase/acylaminoacyl peptidase